MNLDKPCDEPEALFSADIDFINSGINVIHGISITVSKTINSAPFSLINESLINSQKKYENRFLRGGMVPDPLFEINNTKRDKMLKSLLSRGIKTNFANTRLRYGENLSKVCRGCPNGDYGSHINVSMTGHCNKDCFFCYNKYRSSTKQPKLVYESIKKSKNLLNTLSFTGGEPLLELDSIFSLMKLARKKFGSLCYIYTYTNGGLLTEDILIKFKDLGLNEIRFDIAANDYNLEPVKLAKKYIPKVVIETPAIPGEKDLLISAINELEKIGVFFVTLHELLYFGFNSKKYLERNLYLKKPDFRPFYFENAVPVLGSEELVYQIFNYALEKNLKTSLHYCSCDLKQLFQHRSSLFFRSEDRISPQRELKDTGLSQSLLINIKDKDKVIADVTKSSVWNYQVHSEFIEVHPTHIQDLNLDAYEVYIAYWKKSDIVDIGQVISKN